jgi:hypothetical protein
LHSSGGGIALDYSEYDQDNGVSKEEEEDPGVTPLSDRGQVSQALTSINTVLQTIEGKRAQAALAKGEEHAQRRADMMAEMESKGSMATLLSLSLETRETMDIDVVDMINTGMKNLQGMTELFLESTRSATGTEERFDAEAILTVLQATQGLLQECRGDLIKMGNSQLKAAKSPFNGEDYYVALVNRLDMMVGILSKTRSGSLNSILPPDSNADIVNWYLKLNVLLFELIRSKALYRNAFREVEALIMADPGTRLPVPERRPGATTVVSSLKTQESRRAKESMGMLGLMYRPGSVEAAVAFGQGGDPRSQEGKSAPLAGRNAGDIFQHRSAGMVGLDGRYGQEEPQLGAQSRGIMFATQGQGPQTGATPEELWRSGAPTPNNVAVRKKPAAKRGAETDNLSVLSSQSRPGYGSRASHASTPRILGTLEQAISDYASEKLKEANKLNTTTLFMITSTITANRVGKVGNEGKYMDLLKRVQEKMTPDVDGAFVNVARWLTMLNDQATGFGLPVLYMIQLMKDYGGLKDKHCPAVQKQVKSHFTRLNKALPGFQPTHDPSDDEYWVMLWVDVQLWLVINFWVIQSEEIILAKLKGILKALVFTTDNPLNEEFHLVATTFQQMMVYLEDTGSVKQANPGWVMSLLKEHLKALSFAGPLISDFLGKNIKEMVTDPRRFFPPRHGLSEEELIELTMRGEEGLDEEDYELFFNTLKARASQGSLDYPITSLAAGREMFKTVTSKSAAKKAAAAMQVTTVHEKMVNAVASGGGGQQPPACPTCNLFPKPPHESGKPCPYFNKEKKIVHIQTMLETQGALHRLPDNQWVVAKWFATKLRDFFFKRNDINPTDQARVEGDMRVLAKKLGKTATLPTPLVPGNRVTVRVGRGQLDPKQVSRAGEIGQLQRALHTKNKQLDQLKEERREAAIALQVHQAGQEQEVEPQVVELADEDQLVDGYYYSEESDMWIDTETNGRE